MKRRAIRRILITAMLGAITTVAVAWTCALVSVPDRTVTDWGVLVGDESDLADFWLVLTRHRGAGFDRLQQSKSPIPLADYEYEAFGTVVPWWLSRSDRATLAEPDAASSRMWIAQGWPLPALWCEFPDYNTVEGAIFIRREHIPASYQSVERVLAYRPIWLGLAADVGLFGIVWFIFLSLPGIFLRAHRRRRGRCAACGYDMRASIDGRCPECGTMRTAPISQ